MYADRQYTTVLNGKRVSGVADNVTTTDGKRTAVEAKFVEDWESSIRNPASYIEVKTGNADLSIRQSEIFPQIRDGSSIPRGQVAESFGLTPGKPLREQGYPNGIPIEIINFPGAKW